MIVDLYINLLRINTMRKIAKRLVIFLSDIKS